MSTAPLSQALHLNPLHFTTLQTKNTSHKFRLFIPHHYTSHKSRLFIPHHYTSHHFTYLHSPLTWIPLLVTTFLALFLKVLSLQGKDASRLAGNWFQFVMVLFTKEYLPTSVLFFLVLIVFFWSVTMYSLISLCGQQRCRLRCCPHPLLWRHQAIPKSSYSLINLHTRRVRKGKIRHT